MSFCSAPESVYAPITERLIREYDAGRVHGKSNAKRVIEASRNRNETAMVVNRAEVSKCRAKMSEATAEAFRKMCQEHDAAVEVAKRVKVAKYREVMREATAEAIRKLNAETEFDEFDDEYYAAIDDVKRVKGAEYREALCKATKEETEHHQALYKTIAGEAERHLALCKTAVEEAAFRATVVLPVWTRLVLGGAPIALAETLAQDMFAHRNEHGTTRHFSAAKHMEEMDHHANYAVGALLLSMGFTEVEWEVDSDCAGSFWDCAFDYRID